MMHDKRWLPLLRLFPAWSWGHLATFSAIIAVQAFFLVTSDQTNFQECLSYFGIGSLVLSYFFMVRTAQITSYLTEHSDYRRLFWTAPLINKRYAFLVEAPMDDVANYLDAVAEGRFVCKLIGETHSIVTLELQTDASALALRFNNMPFAITRYGNVKHLAEHNQFIADNLNVRIIP